MSFRPAPVPTIFVSIGLVILLNLGLWQLRRNVQAQARLTTFHERFDTRALANADLSGDPGELSWHKAELTGAFLDRPPYLVTNRFEFRRPGYDIVQPYQVEGGPVILVNRGWVPREELDSALDPILADREVPVRGLLLALSEFEHAERLPATADSPERWPPHGYAGMGRALDLPHADVVLIVGDPLTKADHKKPSPLPVTGFIAEPKASVPHLQYAATWFLIGGTLLVIWIVTAVRRGQRLAAGG